MRSVEWPWRVAGTYVEACNCEAVCPCRRYGERPGGRSSYGVCDFALSWHISRGWAGDLDLSGIDVVMAGSFVDDAEARPGVPLGEWGVALYIDMKATSDQASTLEAIFLGRAGGGTLANFAAAIGHVYVVRRARVRLEHHTGRQSIDVEDYVTVRELHPVATDQPVSCGIPGHDHPGTELVAALLRVEESPLLWEVSGRCGFSSDFEYRSADTRS